MTLDFAGPELTFPDVRQWQFQPLQPHLDLDVSPLTSVLDVSQVCSVAVRKELGQWDVEVVRKPEEHRVVTAASACCFSRPQKAPVEAVPASHRPRAPAPRRGSAHTRSLQVLPGHLATPRPAHLHTWLTILRVCTIRLTAWAPSHLQLCPAPLLGSTQFCLFEHRVCLSLATQAAVLQGYAHAPSPRGLLTPKCSFALGISHSVFGESG